MKTITPKAIIACICGSTRFQKEMYTLAKVLTLQNKIVVMPNIFAHQGDVISEEQKTRLDLLHKDKILLADEIYIVTVENYIGNSTRNEIEFSEKHDKKIFYIEMSDIKHWGL